MKTRLISWLPFIAAVVGAVAVLVIVAQVRAAIPRDPTCPPVEAEPYCVVVPGVQKRAEWGQTTRYVLNNETGTVGRIGQQFFDTTGTGVLSFTSELRANYSQNYYVEWAGLPVPYSGTMVLTGSIPFTVQVIGPTVLCPYPVTSACMSLRLPAGSTQYTVGNNEARELTYTHDVYQSGQLLHTFSDTIPPFSRRTYDAATGAPLLNDASGATYDVIIRSEVPIDAGPVGPVDPTPIPTATPTPEYDTYTPYVTRR